MEIEKHSDYEKLLDGIQDKIQESRIKASVLVNKEMLALYWDIGHSILVQQNEKDWGSKVIDKLSSDIKKRFPDVTGFSVRNLMYMRSFAENYPDFPFVQVPLAEMKNEFVQVSLAQIPWYHHISIMTKVKDQQERAFYINETVKNGWSRNVLVFQIKNDLYNRSGKLVSNFEKALPAYQSELATEIFKDPYNFGFLGINHKVKESEIERKLIDKIADFLLELGKGFAYIGRQFPLEVDNKDYKIDLLFYHTYLHCYVVIELKTSEFKPEYISKLNFYINAVDEKVKSERDEQTIGLLLCAEKSNITVEYSLRGINQPLGVAEYELENFVKKELDYVRNINQLKLNE